MAKNYKRKKNNRVVQVPKPGLYLPPSVRRKPQAQISNANILQVIEFDPEKKYIVSFGPEFERAVIQHIKIDPNQFADINSPQSQSLIQQLVTKKVTEKIGQLRSQLDRFASDPEQMFQLIHLGGNDFIKIKVTEKEDQAEETIEFELPEETDGTRENQEDA